MKKRLLNLAAISVIVLTAFNIIFKPVDKEHYGFTRFITQKISREDSAFSIANARIAGIDSDRTLYFYNSPEKIYMSDPRFSKVDSIEFNIDSSIAARSRKFYSIALFEQHFLLNFSNGARTYVFDLDGRLIDTIRYSGKFTKQVVLPNNSYIVRTRDPREGQLLLMKESSVGKILAQQPATPKNIVEGLINNDGVLLFDKLRAQILYVHYYSCKIDMYDTSLAARANWQTLDSFKGVPIKESVSGHRSSNISPERIVNRHAVIDDDQLYVLSKLKGDNENLSYFKEHTLIDIYNLNDGLYKGSMELPVVNAEQAIEFAKDDQYIYVTTQNYIVSYHLQ